MNLKKLESYNLYLNSKYEEELERSKIMCLCVNAITEDVETNAKRFYKKKDLFKIIKLFNELKVNDYRLLLEYENEKENSEILATVSDCMYFEKNLYIEVVMINPKLKKLLSQNFQITPLCSGSPFRFTENGIEKTGVDLETLQGFKIFIK